MPEASGRPKMVSHLVMYHRVGPDTRPQLVERAISGTYRSALQLEYRELEPESPECREKIGAERFCGVCVRR